MPRARSAAVREDHGGRRGPDPVLNNREVDVRLAAAEVFPNVLLPNGLMSALVKTVNITEAAAGVDILAVDRRG